MKFYRKWYQKGCKKSKNKTRQTLAWVSTAGFDVLPNAEKKASFLRFLISGNIQTIFT